MTDLLLHFPPSNHNAAQLRAAIRFWSDWENLSSDIQNDALLVVSELFSNAVRSSPIDSQIEVSLQHTSATVMVRISNTGPGFDPAVLLPPTFESRRGRGLAIAGALGQLRVDQFEDRTTVQVELRT